ncbi:MAG: 30S ribosomal protein S7 [bacterium]
MRGNNYYKKRLIAPDERFGSTSVSKFINYIMERGKKSIAKKLVYDSLDEAAKVLKKEPLDVFNAVLSAIAPSVEVRSRRIGGANYQVPIEVREPRRTALAMRWIIAAAKSKKGMPMHKRLATEFQDILSGTGAAIKKREDTHRMAEANRAFAHFAKMR